MKDYKEVLGSHLSSLEIEIVSPNLKPKIHNAMQAYAREVAVHYLAHIVGTISGGSGKTTPEAYKAFDIWMKENSKQ